MVGNLKMWTVELKRERCFPEFELTMKQEQNRFKKRRMNETRTKKINAYPYKYSKDVEAKIQCITERKQEIYQIIKQGKQAEKKLAETRKYSKRLRIEFDLNGTAFENGV